MPNEVMKFPDLPSYLEPFDPTRRSEFARANKGGMPPHISIKDNRFNVYDSEGELAYDPSIELRGVIAAINKNPSRVFYPPDQPYTPGESAPPTCFSDNGVGASSRAIEPQSTCCKTCPQAVWGSATSRLTHKAIPACSEGMKIAVLIDDDLYMLRIPPASLKHWDNFEGNLARAQRNPRHVVTRISFISQGVLQFDAAAYINEGQAAALKATKEDELDELLNRKDESWRQPGLVAPVLSTASDAPFQQHGEKLNLTDVRDSAAGVVEPSAPPKRTRKPKEQAAAPAEAQAGFGQLTPGPHPSNQAPGLTQFSNSGDAPTRTMGSFTPTPPPPSVNGFLDKAMNFKPT